MRRRNIMPLPAGAKPLGALAASAWTAWAVVAIAAAGWLLRALPLMQGGAFGYPVDYDEGVYFASSSLLLRGALPYRDFAFVHPPGLLYCLWPAAWLGSVRDPSIGFAAARWLFALIGVANVLLVGRVAMRFAGSACAIAAAVVYATHPLAVSIERGPFLEPVLNLCCLWLAWIWLAEDGRKRWQALAAGTVCGLAISVKLVGAVWLLACALSTSRQMRNELLAFFAACAISFAVVVGPVSLAAPAEVWRQTISFQLHRPADGTVAILERLAAIFSLNSQLLKSALVVGGLALAASRVRNPERRGERFFCVAFISIIAVFLSSSSYWSQYNAHLAVPESLLAGYAAAALWAESRSRQARRVLAVAAVGLAGFLGARRAIMIGRTRSPELRSLASFVRSTIPSTAGVLSFEPAWLIAAGRLPAPTGGLLIVDPYGAMLMAATSEGRRFSNASEAFADPASQLQISTALRASRFAILGGRGHWQLSEPTQQWVRSQFLQRFPLPGQDGIDVWERAR